MLAYRLPFRTGIRAILPRPVAELGLPHGIVIASLRPRQTRQVYLLRRAAPLSPAACAIRALLGPGPATR